ncbi:unnamed protein product [Paramecium sonneborni]|uniref:non-specific serine/threonine protein kinase n=1 Tax=Paramecium sonneborni TaxID=65129 RepID=A0A8S1N3L5_9CILI|nr:unnamed protein product [Paramecium sonneborni]
MQECLKFIYKQDKTKNDLMSISQALKKWPQEAQQFRQYCLNSKIFVSNEVPKHVYVVTKGEFVQVKYVKTQSKNPLSYISKIFAQEPQIQKQLRTFKMMDVIGMDEIYNDNYTYDVFCNSTIGEVFCIKKCVFEKIIPNQTMKKKNLQITIENKPCQMIEIHSAKGATPINRLQLGEIPRQPEEISTHRHEKRTIDFTAFKQIKPQHVVQQPIVEELEEPPLNNRFFSVFQSLSQFLKYNRILITEVINCLIIYIYIIITMSNHRNLKDLFPTKLNLFKPKSELQNEHPKQTSKSPSGLSQFATFFQIAQKTTKNRQTPSSQRSATPTKVKIIQLNMQKQDQSHQQIKQKHSRNQSATNINSSRNNSFIKEKQDNQFQNASSRGPNFALSKFMSQHYYQDTQIQSQNQPKDQSPLKPSFYDNLDIINRNTVQKNSQSPNTTVQKISPFIQPKFASVHQIKNQDHLFKQQNSLVKENKPIEKLSQIINEVPQIYLKQQEFQVPNKFKYSKGYENLFNSMMNIQHNSRYENSKSAIKKYEKLDSQSDNEEESLMVDCNIQVNKNSFQFHYVIGKGGFGKVWKVEIKKSRQFYAMKEMSKAKVIAKRSVNSVMNERNLLAQYKHPFLINMNYCFQDRHNLYLVMDLLTGGDLRYHIGKMRRFKEHQTKFFIACVLLSLEYLHNNNIIHRDLKPENLVLDKYGYVRLTDLGIARMWKPDNSQDTSGTPGYMAPEVMCRQNHTIAVDYFALGIMGYEFMLGRRPYNGRSRQEIRDQILTRQVQIKKSEVPNDWSIEGADFINKLIQRKPINRLGFKGPDEVKNHPWLRNFPWTKLLNKEIQSPYIPKEIDDNIEYLNQISEDNESQDDLIKENKILLKKNSVQNLFSGYSYENNLSRNTKSTSSTFFLG